MSVWRGLHEVPEELGRTVVTIGNFDGVHLGHRALIRRGRRLADYLQADALVAVTFNPHPLAVLRPASAPAPLTTLDERLRLLTEAGVDNSLVMAFNSDLADWPAEEFITRILADGLHAIGVVVGSNFRFGSHALGDLNSLRRAGSHHDFEVEAVALDGGVKIWSSTLIRTLIASGDVLAAANVLGRPFSLMARIVLQDDAAPALDFWPFTDSPPGAFPGPGSYLCRLRQPDTGVHVVGTVLLADGTEGMERVARWAESEQAPWAFAGSEVEVSFLVRN